MPRKLIPIFLALAALLTTSNSVSAAALSKPNVVKVWELFTGQRLEISISDSLSEIETYKATVGLKGLDYSCVTSSGTCQVLDWWPVGDRIITYVYVRNYLQGSQLKVKVNRTLVTNQGGSLQSFVEVSQMTLNPTPYPVRGEVTPEVGKCSFSILNFDKRFDYFFKSYKWEISKAGRVTLYPYPGQTYIPDYISITRKGYVLINALDTYFECHFLHS